MSKKALIIRIVLSVILAPVFLYSGLLIFLMTAFNGLGASAIGTISCIMLAIAAPLFVYPMIWVEKKHAIKVVVMWLIYFVIALIPIGCIKGYETYQDKITIDTAPNIRTSEYLPFIKESKIVKYKSETSQFNYNLPRIDGAAALFPVYSAFVNATYPETTELHDGIFEYRNTPSGYKALAEKESDIFIGVYPSKEQIKYAEENNTTFEYTQIGYDAFVFFTHKDNPVDSLTMEQIKGIYSGEITNWSQVGGKDIEIAAFQRNEGSGSQSMLKRLMGDKPIMDPPKDKVNDLMSGIINVVANYKSKSNSIGFSFRFYVEGIIKNPDIKILAIDGVYPTKETVSNETYPIVTPFYAVTYKEQTNENVNELVEWILGPEGQKIIDETGYIPIK